MLATLILVENVMQLYTQGKSGSGNLHLNRPLQVVKSKTFILQGPQLLSSIRFYYTFVHVLYLHFICLALNSMCVCVCVCVCVCGFEYILVDSICNQYFCSNEAFYDLHSLAALFITD